MSFRVGDRVECNWQNRGINFRGTIASINGNTYDIKFDDGDFDVIKNIVKIISIPFNSNFIKCFLRLIVDISILSCRSIKLKRD